MPLLQSASLPASIAGFTSVANSKAVTAEELLQANEAFVHELSAKGGVDCSRRLWDGSRCGNETVNVAPVPSHYFRQALFRYKGGASVLPSTAPGRGPSNDFFTNSKIATSSLVMSSHPARAQFQQSRQMQQARSGRLQIVAGMFQNGLVSYEEETRNRPKLEQWLFNMPFRS
jgi:hypothetical protein